MALMDASDGAGTTTTSINDLDASTLANVLSRLPPEAILSATTACKHIHSSADEPMWKGLFDEAWDEPAWEVESYRDLYLARHRALTLVEAVARNGGSGVSGDVEGGGKVPKTVKKGINGAGEDYDDEDDEEDDFDRIASCCEELTRAVNASKRVVKTDKTLEAAECLRGLRRMLLIVKKRMEADGRRGGETSWSKASSSSSSSTVVSKDTASARALLAVCSAISALIVRCDSARVALLATHENTIGKQLLQACFASSSTGGGGGGGGNDDDDSTFFRWLPGVSSVRSGSGWGQQTATAERTPPASLDALAASLGGVPTPKTTPTWPPKEKVVPRVDLALALVCAPLCLLGAEGRETTHGYPLPSHPFLAVSSLSRSVAAAAAAAAAAASGTNDGNDGNSDGDDTNGGAGGGGGGELVPVVASVPGRGPWPRGGRPPHGQRLRMERVGSPPSVESIGGAWFGCRMSLHDDGFGGGGASGGGVSGAAVEAATVDTVFRATLSVTSDGKVTGWMNDTTGNLTLRGEIDPNGGGRVVIEAAFNDCGGLPGVMFSSLQHGRARLRMCGWATATVIAGEWRQWSGGRVTRGLFLLWPNDDGKEGKRGLKRT